MKTKTCLSAAETAVADAARLRDSFLLERLFAPGEANIFHGDIERVIVGGIVPTKSPLDLLAPASFKAGSFTQRREVGVINVGGAGAVLVGKERFALDACDALYVGAGEHAVRFESADASRPAEFYMVSYPAHRPLPTKLVARAGVTGVALGNAEEANRRTIYKLLCPQTVETCQLVMGLTVLEPGSVWNTMPCHTHENRSEVYLYFDMGEGMVFHLMGRPDNVRSIVVRDRQAVLSPRWSIHAGCGSRRYSFIWAMGGENQDFSDMQPVDMKELR